MEITDEAREHFENAQDYRGQGQIGLAIAELDQAVAAEPGFADAVRARSTALTEQANLVRAQGTAEAAVGRAQAETQLAARVASYARSAPKGEWGASGGNVGVSVGDFSYFTASRFNVAASGWRYVAFGIGVGNRGTSSIHVNPNNVTVVDQKGSSYRYNSVTHSWCNTPLQAVDVRPGDNAGGCLVFYMPADTGPAKVIYRTASIRGVDVVIDLEREPL